MYECYGFLSSAEQVSLETRFIYLLLTTTLNNNDVVGVAATVMHML